MQTMGGDEAYGGDHHHYASRHCMIIPLSGCLGCLVSLGSGAASSGGLCHRGVVCRGVAVDVVSDILEEVGLDSGLLDLTARSTIGADTKAVREDLESVTLSVVLTLVEDVAADVDDLVSVLLTLRALLQVLPELQHKIVCSSSSADNKILEVAAGLGVVDEHLGVVSEGLVVVEDIRVVILNEVEELLGSVRILLGEVVEGELILHDRSLRSLLVAQDALSMLEDLLSNSLVDDTPVV